MTHITLFSDAAYTESKEAVVTDGKYMVEGLRTLTPAERDALTRTATSRSEAHGLVTRAQIVLDGDVAPLRRAFQDAASDLKRFGNDGASAFERMTGPLGARGAPGAERSPP